MWGGRTDAAGQTVSCSVIDGAATGTNDCGRSSPHESSSAVAVSLVEGESVVVSSVTVTSKLGDVPILWELVQSSGVDSHTQ